MATIEPFHRIERLDLAWAYFDPDFGAWVVDCWVCGITERFSGLEVNGMDRFLAATVNRHNKEQHEPQ